VRGGCDFPSPLAGEGGPARSDGPDEGYGAVQTSPHPPASQAPSPARGEGKERSPHPPALQSPSPARGAGNGRQPSRVVAKARALRRNMTEPERKLWYLLRSRRFSGFKFRRQVPIGRYVVDFVSLEARLIVEADGSQHCENAHDATRDAWLVAQDFHIRRFWNADIMTKPGEIADTLWHDLNPTPHPAFGHLLPQGEKG
jgi:very-short-patch-repair endonuclease